MARGGGYLYMTPTALTPATIPTEGSSFQEITRTRCTTCGREVAVLKVLPPRDTAATGQGGQALGQDLRIAYHLRGRSGWCGGSMAPTDYPKRSR